LIHSHWFWDLFFSLVARTTRNQKWSAKAMYWRNDRFGRTVARLIQEQKPAAVYCYETTAYEAFKACEKVSSIKILEHISGHYETSRSTLIEERKLHPELSEDLRFTECEKGRERWIQESQMADKIVVPSSFVANTLLEIGIDRSRIIIIPYGVDTERFQPRSAARPPGPIRVLYAGRIHPLKGVIYLLEAFKQLQLADAELILLGSGDISGKRWIPYQGLFRYIPSVPYEEMPQVYQAADLFVFPSLHEGSALVIYEAMASGLPVITTENAGSIIQNGEDGWIVPIRDVEALKEKISLMIANRELRDAMGARARQRAEQFNWAAYRKNLIRGLNHSI
jgi:glycosyltransferase involved in cell wall biosynthesis